MAKSAGTPMPRRLTRDARGVMNVAALVRHPGAARAVVDRVKKWKTEVGIISDGGSSEQGQRETENTPSITGEGRADRE